MTRRVCAECEEPILKREGAVCVEVMLQQSTDWTWSSVGKIYLHPACYRRTGLAGRWKKGLQNA